MCRERRFRAFMQRENLARCWSNIRKVARILGSASFSAASLVRTPQENRRSRRRATFQSVGGRPAVDVDRLAANDLGGVGQQKDDHTPNLHRLDMPPEIIRGQS